MIVLALGLHRHYTPFSSGLCPFSMASHRGSKSDPGSISSDSDQHTLGAMKLSVQYMTACDQSYGLLLDKTG